MSAETLWKPVCGTQELYQWADLRRLVRDFFAQRDVLEVDTPILSTTTVTDPQIGSFQLPYREEIRYLQTSPEFFMKRLLASGSGDIYQIVHAFRTDEFGRWHNPEFTLLEWYRVGWTLPELIAEIIELIDLLAGELTGRTMDSVTIYRYQDIFRDALDLDPLTADIRELSAAARNQGLDVIGDLSREQWRDWLFSACVTPRFSADTLTVVKDYPVDQAALARIRLDQDEVAERFEVFAGHLELANGYHELADPREQAQRFLRDNEIREQTGLLTCPADENLLAALEYGLPDCSGVALGLDRLLMKLAGKDEIAQVMPFPWPRA